MSLVGVSLMFNEVALFIFIVNNINFLNFKSCFVQLQEYNP